MFNWLWDMIFGPNEASFKRMNHKQQMRFIEKNRQGKVRIRERRQADRKLKRDMKKRGW